MILLAVVIMIEAIPVTALLRASQRGRAMTLTPELVLSIVIVARQTIARLRPLGMHVEAGTLLLVPGLTEKDFDTAAGHGCTNVKFIFYDWSTGEPGEAEQYVSWARQRGMTVKIHSGGVSRSGASVVAGFDVVRRVAPDVIGHISGGPIPMPDQDIERTIRETGCFAEICSSMNYRASLVALKALQEEGALHRLTLGTDTPGGTGVIPRGMLRNILFLSGVGGLAPELAIAAATGNTARAHKLPAGRIEVGAPADVVVCDKIFGAAGTNALESMGRGDLPGISIVVEHFERLGILKVERGSLRIGDRDQLLGLSCDCYGVIKANYEQVGR